VLRSLIAHNEWLGVGSFGSALTLESTVVRDTQPDPQGRFGNGVVLMGGGSGSLVGTAVTGNATAGVVATGPGTSLSVAYSVASTTQPGGHAGSGDAFGDGIVAADQASVVVERAVASNGARSGLFFDHAAGGLDTTVVRGNSWAVVAQDSALDWKHGQNDLACNEHPGVGNPGLPVPDVSGLNELDPSDLIP
jgi:hypothetical protein